MFLQVLKQEEFSLLDTGFFRREKPSTKQLPEMLHKYVILAPTTQGVAATLKSSSGAFEESWKLVLIVDLDHLDLH